MEQVIADEEETNKTVKVVSVGCLLFSILSNSYKSKSEAKRPRSSAFSVGYVSVTLNNPCNMYLLGSFGSENFIQYPEKFKVLCSIKSAMQFTIIYIWESFFKVSLRLCI